MAHPWLPSPPSHLSHPAQEVAQFPSHPSRLSLPAGPAAALPCLLLPPSRPWPREELKEEHLRRPFADPPLGDGFDRSSPTFPRSSSTYPSPRRHPPSKTIVGVHVRRVRGQSDAKTVCEIIAKDTAQRDAEAQQPKWLTVVADEVAPPPPPASSAASSASARTRAARMRPT